MNLYDEYKYFGDLAQQQSQRRQNSSQTYLTVNTAIFGIMALLVKDSGLHGWSLVLACLPLFVVGIIACVVWLTIIARYKRMIGWYFAQLREMEGKIDGSYMFYTKEWNIFFSRPQFNFSNLESFMPRIFMGLYFVYIIGMVVAVKYRLL